MEVVRELALWLLLGSGAAFCIVGGIGLLRFPDVYARMHAAGIIDTAAAGSILIGLALEPAPATSVVKLVVIVFFLYITTSTSNHALANAAFTSGLVPFGSHDDANGAPEP